ncbi:hypothetical protein ACFWPH_28505 [Nocardia sp. NPDC058499]|uniref:hypothetical protein n=1 Tax=Nocardia sp. NPDC058499 TaxID=3346530 RepID=UPI003653A18E
MAKKSCNPFRDAAVEHDSGDDALCLSRAHDLDPDVESLRQYTLAAVVNAWEDIPQPAFFNARHSAELLLKTLLPGYEQDKRLKRCHSLTTLLAELATRSDDLLGTGEDQQLIVEFIRELDRHDPNGDQGRYPRDSHGSPSLEKLCCADRDEFVREVARLARYGELRLTGQPHVTMGQQWPPTPLEQQTTG